MTCSRCPRRVRQHPDPAGGPRFARSAVLAAVVLLVAACSTSPSPSASVDPNSPEGSASSPPVSSAGIAFARDGDLYLLDPGTSEMRQLTDLPDNEILPAWSPDGTRIAFIGSDGEAFQELFVINADGTNLRQLTDTTDMWEGGFGWSPDSGRIVYSAWPDGGKPQNIFVIDADGSDGRQLTDVSGQAMNPAWSPDESAVLYTYEASEGDSEIHAMRPDGSDDRAYPRPDGYVDIHPGWSPDGTFIVFNRGSEALRDPDQLFRMRADGSQVVQLTSYTFAVSARLDYPAAWSPGGRILFAAGVERLPFTITSAGADPRQLADVKIGAGYSSWSPDGTQVVHTRTAGDSDNDLWVMNADSGAAVQLTSGPHDDRYPAWSPPGSAPVSPGEPNLTGRIAFSAGRALDVLDLDTGRIARVAEVTRRVIEPRWSPDGTRIAFVEANVVERSPEDLYGEVWVVGADGSDLRQITRPLSQYRWKRSVGWSPSGAQIVYRAGGYNEEPTNIFVMNADGTGVRQLTDTHDPETGGARWSPDGTRLLWSGRTDGEYELYLIDPDGTGRTAIFPAGDGYRDGGGFWSPDGSQIVFFRGDIGQSEIFRANSDGSGVTQLTDGGMAENLSDGCWSPDGTHIAYFSGGQLWVMSSDGSEKVQLTAAVDPTSSPAWSPDGQYIVHTRLSAAGGSELWVIDITGTTLVQLTDGGLDRDPAWYP